MLHLGGVHPGGEPVGVQALPVFEKFEPALFFGGDLGGGEFAQLEEGDATMIKEAAAALVAQTVAVGVAGILSLSLKNSRSL